MLFAGKTAIISGTASGIGRATADLLLKNGAKKVIGGDLSKYYDLKSDKFKHQELNVGYKESIKNFYEFAKIELDGKAPDLLVNNAGITLDNTMAKMEEHQWDTMMTVNLSSIFYMTQPFYMWAREDGKMDCEKNPRAIVNLSSISAKVGNFGQANYCAAKAGVYGITKNNAREFAQYNIRVNAISPGFIETPMVAAMPPKVVKRMVMGNIPMQRTGRVDEIANACLYLGSDMSSYVTGVNLEVAGGLGMS